MSLMLLDTLGSRRSRSHSEGEGADGMRGVRRVGDEVVELLY